MAYLAQADIDGGNLTAPTTSGFTGQFNAITLPSIVSDDAAIRAAAAAAIAAGGGTVIIYGRPSAPIMVDPTKRGFPVASNLGYEGRIPSSCIERGTDAGAGVILQGDGNLNVSPGTFDCFEVNGTDQANFPYSTPEQAFAAAPQGFSLRNLTLRCFNAAIRFGAFRNFGVADLVLHKVVFASNAIGLHAENCHRLNIGRISFQNHADIACRILSSTGYVTVGATSQFWNFGNGTAGRMESQNFAEPICSRRSRGFEIGARGNGSQLNNMLFHSIQHNGRGYDRWQQPSSQIFTSGSDQITVTSNIGYYAIDTLVYFTAVGGGFTNQEPYFIVDKTDNGNDTGTIKLSRTRGGASISATSTGSGVINVIGATGIAIGGRDSSLDGLAATFPLVTNSTFSLIDAEKGGTCNAAVQRILGCSVYFSILDGVTGTVNYAGINIASENNIFMSRAVVNWYANQRGASYYGRRPSSYFGQATGLHLGILNDGGNVHVFGTARTGNVGDFHGAGSSYFTAALELQLRQKHFTFASGKAITWSDGGHGTYSGTAAGTATLPSITAEIVGAEIHLVNPSAATLTVSTTGGQTVNGASGVTSFSLAANTPATFRASTTDGTTFFWSAK